MSKPPIAYARCLKIKNMTALATAEAHARRYDNSKHVDRSRTAQTLVSGYGESPDPLALQNAYRQRKRDAGASERKGSAIGLGVVCGRGRNPTLRVLGNDIVQLKQTTIIYTSLE